MILLYIKNKFDFRPENKVSFIFLFHAGGLDLFVDCWFSTVLPYVLFLSICKKFDYEPWAEVTITAKGGKSFSEWYRAVWTQCEAWVWLSQMQFSNRAFMSDLRLESVFGFYKYWYWNYPLSCHTCDWSWLDLSLKKKQL